MRIQLIDVLLAIVTLQVFSIPSTLLAQETDGPNSARAPIANAARTATVPDIDGRLDESLWQEAPVISDFRQHEPFEGHPPSERAEVRIVYDNAALYVGARMFDSKPGELRFGENRRDTGLQNADALLIVFDRRQEPWRTQVYIFLGIRVQGALNQERIEGP